ncbi:hypothetical protein N7530_011209 [Penicillium desertorum]|uniref:Uncharacterized protein n=1 Tax=Penicillium desertorum TaxID=1303715 RepID=A0A9W9WGQ4_9EURO|nr:hypothetical protein N7530_011209 [Penicillium desertorum]
MRGHRGWKTILKGQDASQLRLLGTGSAGLWMLVRTREIADLRQGEKGEEGVEEEKEHLAHFLPPGGHDKRTSGSRKMFVLCVV